MDSNHPNHYATLRVSRHASAQDLRLAYRRLAQEFHPDRYQGEGNASVLMARINDAYATLCDPDKRASYDGLLVPSRACTVASARRHWRPTSWRQGLLSRWDRLRGWPTFVVVGALASAVVSLGLSSLHTVSVAAPAVALQVPAAALLLDVHAPVPLVPTRSMGSPERPALGATPSLVAVEPAEPKLKLAIAGSVNLSSLQKN